uniref:Protein kinase domain-containing protein n=1 Tax=Kalanchoe fedtschenkoi TaxID=63787 RepID=A0A7N0VL86_KALFE
MLSDLVPEANETENEVCSLAIIVLIAADKLQRDQSSFDDFYSCLPNLDVFDSLLTTILALLFVVLGVLLVVGLVKYVSKGQARSPARHKEDPAWSGLYRFTKVEIENALNFWGDRRYLGRGSAGLVYMGVLPSGQNVAVKHIFKTNNSDSFFREVAGLSRIRHSNLACLLGYCVEDGEQFLVFEYCSGGNLSQRLLRKDTVLTWYDRVKILRHCALALRFLHDKVDGCIVHRDIKLTNILLTDDLIPKLSDFGLAKLLKMEQSKVFTDVRGTIGYMDPEYMTNAKLTCASDIYSFGIVTLQLLSGQKVIELDLDARDQLTRKAKDVSLGSRPLSDFIDPRLNGAVTETDFESILQIAVLCVARSSKSRPSIDVVFRQGYKDDSFILAEQAKQIFYVTDPIDPTYFIVVNGKQQHMTEESLIDDDIVPVISRVPSSDLHVDDGDAYCQRTDHTEGIWIQT